MSGLDLPAGRQRQPCSPAGPDRLTERRPRVPQPALRQLVREIQIAGSACCFWVIGNVLRAFGWCYALVAEGLSAADVQFEFVVVAGLAGAPYGAFSTRLGQGRSTRRVVRVVFERHDEYLLRWMRSARSACVTRARGVGARGDRCRAATRFDDRRGRNRELHRANEILKSTTRRASRCGRREDRLSGSAAQCRGCRLASVRGSISGVGAICVASLAPKHQHRTDARNSSSNLRPSGLHEKLPSLFIARTKSGRNINDPQRAGHPAMSRVTRRRACRRARRHGPARAVAPMSEL